MGKKFDDQQPGQYSVEYQEPDGTVGQTAPVSYAETGPAADALEESGVHVTGVVKNPGK